MADQIEVQGENVIITTQTTVAKEQYLIERQYELANLQNQERVIEAEIARVQAIIDSLEA
jgi:hypothetical protein